MKKFLEHKYWQKFFFSQNRLEYEKRVRAQAKAMAANSELMS